MGNITRKPSGASSVVSNIIEKSPTTVDRLFSGSSSLDCSEDHHPSDDEFSYDAISRPTRENEHRENGLSDRKTSINYWRQRLQTVEPCFFPRLTAKIVPSTPSSKFHSILVEPDRGAAELHQFCKSNNVSRTSMFMVAWGLVLRTYTTSDHICFGHGVARRDISAEDLVAASMLPANILPLVIEFTEHANSLDVVSKLESDFASEDPNRGISLVDIYHELGVGRDGLFNTAIISGIGELLSNGHEAHDLSGKSFESKDDQSEYNIIITVSSEWSCSIHCRDGFLSHGQAEHLANALGIAISSIVESPNQEVTEIEVFSRLDQQKLSQWNGEKFADSEYCLHDLIAKHCHSQPESLAVVSWDGKLTYGELDRLSSALACQLHAVGVGPEIFVTTYFDRCKWMPVAMLGIMKAGGAICALDLSYPHSRLEDICQQLKSSVILTTVNNAAQAARLARTVIIIEETLSAEQNGHDDRAKLFSSSSIRPSNALYAVFTSGSTGKPKGVVVEHKSFSSCALASLKPLNIQKNDRILHFASYAFDLSIFEPLTALTAGASVAIPSEEMRKRDLPSAVKELGATWSFLTPTVARLYQPEQFSSLQTLCLGGEAVRSSDIETWASKNVITGYNPAESCPLGISGPANCHEPSFLGWSFSSQAAWIVDARDSQKLVPIGAIGELVIEGPAVARGYIHDPESSLPDSPFIVTPPRWLSRFRASAAQNTRLYRTGDIVRYGHDGAIHFLGRKDLQVKVRGQRIELSEIETHIQKALFPFTGKAVVEAVNFGDRTIVVAFITSNESGRSTDGGTKDYTQQLEMAEISDEFETRVADVESNLRKILPTYMVPTAYIPVAHIPTSMSGKIDRARLKSLALSLPHESLYRKRGHPASGGIPTTDMERRLQGLFAQVLHLSPDQVTLDSDFFDLGGDSIQAMKLLALAPKEGLQNLGYQDIFHHSRLRDMASVCSSSRDLSPSATSDGPNPMPFEMIQNDQSLKTYASRQCGIAIDDIEDMYPCTPLQTSLMASTAQEQDAYVAVQSFALHSNSDVQRVKTAWSLVVENNPILRTRIVQTDMGVSYQVVVRGPVSFLDEAINNKQPDVHFYPKIGLGTPLIHLCLTQSHLLVAMHHAIYDGWSLPLLLREIDSVYRELPIQRRPLFSSFVKYIEDNKVEAAPFWTAELDQWNGVHFPTLPHLEYQPKPQSLVTESVSLAGPADAQPHVTVATQIQLAWALTSYTYTRSKDTIFGVVSSGRAVPVLGVQDMLGPTIASTPLRVLIDPSQEVLEALEDVQYRLVERNGYEQFGLRSIAQKGGDPAKSCSFQTMIVVEPDEPAEEAQGTWFSSHSFLSELTSFSSHALTLRCQVSRKSIALTAIFDPSVVSDRQMQRILSLFKYILTQIRDVRSADTTTIGDIDRLSPNDRDEIYKWNALLPLRPNRCVHAMIQDKAQEQPKAPAIHSWDGNMSYEELEDHAGRLSSYIQKLGVGTNTFVAVYFQRSLWTVIAQLAVLKAGAAFATLESSQPIDHLRQVCNTVRPVVFLTSEELRTSAESLAGHPKASAPVLVINKQFFLREADGHSKLPQYPIPSASDAMYIVATSGTTGIPKVVVVEHGAFLANSKQLLDRLGFSKETRALQFSGYSFDAMIVEHFFTLLAGGCICIPSSSDRENSLATSMNKMGVNFAILTASVIHMLTPEEVPLLKTLVQGGEPMTQGIIDRWAPSVRLFNGYGPAETAVFSSSSNPIQPDNKYAKNIGFATGGVCWVVDLEHQDITPVSIGAEGELVVEGAILARGYLNDPIQTDAVFTSRPRWLQDFRAGSGENRIYRTGDIVRYDVDGSIIYLRRKDSQIKLRGQRVELLEVENHVQNCFQGALQVVAAVVKLPGVQSSSLVALVMTTSTSLSRGQVTMGSPGIHVMNNTSDSFLLPTDSEFLSSAHAAELELQERVPLYMVPSLFIPICRVPRDTSGKVNRKLVTEFLSLLPRADWDNYASTTKVAPSTDFQHELQRIWARVLGISPDTIGIDQSFFRLGGDSITCMQVAAQCSAAGMNITVKDIFQHRTIEKLTAGAVKIHQFLEPSTKTLSNTTDVSSSLYGPSQLEEYMIQARSQLGEHQTIEDIYPCSDVQRGILMSCARNISHYEEAIQWRVLSEAPVDVNHLRDAWVQVVNRHAVLRTVFMDISGENFSDQVVLQNYTPTVIISENNDDDDDVEIAAPEPASHPQPLLYLVIRRSSLGKVTISLHINHALVDGHSLFAIRQDLALAYEGKLSESPAPTPYRDYIAYMQLPHSRTNSSKFWKSYIEGTQPCLFPSLKGPSEQDQPLEQFGAVDLELTTTSNLTQFCEDHKLALTSVLHVVWAIVMQAYTAMDEVCFTFMTSGRHIPLNGAQDIVGPLFNILVARVDLPRDAPVVSLMQTYQDNFLASLDHQHQSLSETLHSIGSTPEQLFNTMISVFNDTREKQDSAQPGVSSIDLYPITLNIIMLPDQSHLQIAYHKSYLADEYAKTLARIFRHVLTAVLAQPHARLNEIEVLDEDNKSELYNRNSIVPASTDICIHYSIYQQCLDSPDSPAVCAWDGNLTYKELDQISSSLAEDLISLGVGADTVIPVLLEKTRWTPVAVLAILKSAASFVLMDASHPSKRLQSICEATKARLVISSPHTRSKAADLAMDTIEISDRLFDRIRHTRKQSSWQKVMVKGSYAAYLVFTSGSTGTPKGAVVNHSSLATAAETLSSRMRMTSATRTLQFSSHAWDIPITDILLTLRVGGCVCIPSDEERTGDIAQAANKLRANWAFLTPTVARLMRPQDLTHMTTLVLGGESISPTDLNTWHDKVCLLGGYGPAECSLISTVSEPLGKSSNARNIGRPNGCVAWIVQPDNYELLVPPGAVGELILEGPIVGRGYINDPERSAAAFIDPPTWLVRLRTDHASNRLYRTGDLVRYGVDGSLIFVGRRDDQIKIRGQRVELGEVQALVSKAFPGSHVVVELVKGSNSVELIALIKSKQVALDETQAPLPPGSASIFYPPSSLFRQTVKAAASKLRALMPLYMVPTVFLPLIHLPMAQTGKTDRKLLRQQIASLSRQELEAYGIGADVNIRAPSTPLEALLQGLIARALHKPPESIPLDEDLFTAGLDSLTAMTVATSAREDGLVISVPTIFKYPRLSDLAVILTQEQGIKRKSLTRATSLNPLEKSVDEICAQWRLNKSQVIDIVPTTYFQRGHIAAQHANFIALHFCRPIDPGRLKNAVLDLVRKHAILRTAFVPFKEDYAQISLRHFDLPIQEITIDEEDPSVGVESICREEDRKEIVAFGIPSTKLLLVSGRQTDGPISIVFRLHRAQYDGVAMSGMIADFRSALGESIYSPSAAPLLEYASFITGRIAHNTPSVFQEWREILQGSQMSYLVPPHEYIRSTDRTRTELLVTSSCDIPMPEVKGGVTMATVVKAAWALCVAQHAQSKDIVFAQLVRNRHLDIAGIESTVGPCINYIPVRVPLKAEWTAKELLQWIRRQHIQTMTSDTADWDEIVAKSTDWPHDTEFGSAVHYLSAPVAPSYVFPGNIPCNLAIHDFKMIHTYPMVTCIPFPSPEDVTKKVLKVILTSAVFGQELADQLLSMFLDMIYQLNSFPGTVVRDLIEPRGT
ncbi:lysergyl peptide synthetase subunit 1 [Daldinia decipiens]|uniref:lysergyl peptide synthetase subunit 1 n=1 Tax=Daldinia decipiens TaxID=326647 RepID=UPI0020C2C278|nr:lysergyl peptide synthetase subunit 1 [Daldinia decipiens]KAI1658834.1 lysergyl peptide synthetase subunit 1 [Daldinia decipiens]